MVRRTVLLLTICLGAASALLLGALGAAASADGSGPVVAGTFVGRLTVTQSSPDIATKSGPRTLSFGQGCDTTKACSFSRTSDSKTGIAQKFTPSGGGNFGWAGRQVLACYDTVTGALGTTHGAIDTYSVKMRPSGTTTVNGVTYVTTITGTYQEQVRITAAGVADNCSLRGSGGRVANARGTYTFHLQPLAAPPPIAQSPPIALPPSATRVTTATVKGFHLPQSKHQSASAAAVSAGLRSSVPGSLVEPADALKSVGSRLPQDLLLVAVLGLLIVFPAQLFNSTYEENHDRIDRQLARLRFWRRRPTVATSTVGAIPAQAPDTGAPPDPVPVASRVRRLSLFLGCALVGTLLAGFLDPGFGTNTASYALVTGVFLAVMVTVLVVVLAGRVYRSASHHETGWFLEAIPSALLVAAVCVLVSRLTSFEPGYLYGVLGGAVFVAALDRRAEGRAEVTVAVVALLLALGSWFLFEPVSHAANDAGAGYPILALDSLLACLFIGGLEGMLFGLIPLRFLPGARIKNWSWIAWAVLTAIVAYVFVHVLLMPESGYLGRSTAASVTTTIALFAAFAVVSVLFWAYFRWRPTPEEATGEESAALAPVEGSTDDTAPDLHEPEAEPALVPVDPQGEVVDGTTPRVPRQQGPTAGDRS